ncbi:MAG: family transcriptional regulator [Micrococcaceae bacterium]|jgi:DNA-binding Xre family transcriptional regulator|nr:family transcriptional regulator [Micrococcaceae bacterium]
MARGENSDPTPMTRAAAAVIRAQMNVLQITQADLVRDTSMSQPMMSRLLKGHNVFDLAQLDEVCALLKINPADVLVRARENATSRAPRHQEK